MQSTDAIDKKTLVGEVDESLAESGAALARDGSIEAREIAEDDSRSRREQAEEAILKAGNFDPEQLGLRTDIVTRRASDIAMDGPYAAAFAEAACWSHRSLHSMVTELQTLMTDLHSGCDPKVAARRIAGMIGQSHRDA